MENQCSQIMLYRKSLKRKLAPMRYEHSLSVSYTCMNLAMRYGCSLDKAELAGLMHDCGKRYSDDIILKKCLKHGIEVTEHKYQITDREILDAIGCHTTGRPEMTILDKILYIADYIEPRRYKADNLPMIRRMAYEDLDETMYAILAGTLDYLEKKGGSIDPMTAQAYEYFKKVKGERDELKGNGETGISGSQR